MAKSILGKIVKHKDYVTFFMACIAALFAVFNYINKDHDKIIRLQETVNHITTNELPHIQAAVNEIKDSQKIQYEKSSDNNDKLDKILNKLK